LALTLYPIQDAMVRGEVSPRLHARASLDLYRAGLSKCSNFITLPHGGIRKRGGTMYVAPQRDEARRAYGIPFKFNSEQAYLLEMGHFFVRVYAYGAYVTEFATIWDAADVSRLQYVQSGNVMWLVHPNYPPCKITRVTNSTWTVSTVQFDDGPFASQNFDETKTVYASAITGAVTVTANSGIFSASDVGRLFRIEMESYRGIPPWEPLARIDPGNQNGYARYDGNVYRIEDQADPGTQFGNTPPTHTKGVEQDGQRTYDGGTSNYVGVNLRYLHSGFGVVRITGFTSSTVVTGTVVSRLPEQVVGSGNPAYLWSFGAFNTGEYPVAVTIFEERLCFASDLSVYCSKTGDFETFRTGEKDDDALEFLLAGNEANTILWLADIDGFLAVGTIGGVRALSGSGIDEALTPSSFKNRASKTFRCSPIAPVNTGQATLYVASGGRVLAEMQSAQNGRFEAADATQVSEHITKQGGGITCLSHQEYPDSIAWSALGSKELMGFTYQRDQEVRGFHRHLLGGGGGTENVAVTPGRNGVDDVWMMVQRGSRRYIEMLSSPMEYGSVNDVWCLDSALRYVGTPVNAVSGMGHLGSGPVTVLADGITYEGLPIVSGVVTLPGGVTASNILVGLPYEAEADTLELDVGGRDGSRIGRRKRVMAVILSLFETDLPGLEVSSLIKGRWEKANLASIAPKSNVMTLYTGNVQIPVDDSWSGQARVRIRHTGAGPCTIRAIVPAMDGEP
jgi:hypothetical protein